MALQRIAIADDDPHVRDMLAESLEEAGYATFGGPWQRDFCATLGRRPPHLLVLSIHATLPDWSFVDALGAAPETAALPVLICCDDQRQTQRAMVALLQHGGLVHASSYDPDEVASKSKQLIAVTAARTHVASLVRSVGR
jgi:DNA-binding response OmpR family regulator